MGSGAGGFVLIITSTIVVMLLALAGPPLKFFRSRSLGEPTPAKNHSRRQRASASLWITSASNARASLKFTLLVLAVLVPMAVVLLQLSPKAQQIGDVAISAGGKILIAGGFSSSMQDFTATTELFDPTTNTFAAANQTASMNTGRDGATASLLISGPNTGKVLIAGGAGASSGGEGVTILATTELYDPATNSFAAANQTATMNAARGSATATMITSGPNAGKILIAGGANATSALASTELYDPATNTFAAANHTASMNVGRYGATATVLSIGPNAGKILIAGGADTADSLASTELYDPATNTFAAANQTASMNSARFGATATVLTTGPNAGKILFAGGFGAAPSSGALASTELYDPVTNTFASAMEQTASMNTARYLATATLLVTNGLAAGRIFDRQWGNSTGGVITASSELYDPATNSFAAADLTPSMNTARLQATANTILTGPNAGEILIAGGASRSIRST